MLYRVGYARLISARSLNLFYLDVSVFKLSKNSNNLTFLSHKLFMQPITFCSNWTNSQHKMFWCFEIVECSINFIWIVCGRDAFFSSVIFKIYVNWIFYKWNKMLLPRTCGPFHLQQVQVLHKWQDILDKEKFSCYCFHDFLYDWYYIQV